jgi:hypothetical protein
MTMTTTEPSLETSPGMLEERNVICKLPQDSSWSHSDVEISQVVHTDDNIEPFVAISEDPRTSNDEDYDDEDCRKPELVESIDEAATSSDDGSLTKDLKIIDLADDSDPLPSASSDDGSLTQDLKDVDLADTSSETHPLMDEHEKQQHHITSMAEDQQQIASILHNILASVEPHHYSIATHKDPHRPLGLKLWELDQGGMLVMGIADGQANSIFVGTSTSDVYPVDGDVLIGVNDDSCTSAETTLLDVKRMVDQSDGKLLTLTFRRPTCKSIKKKKQLQQKQQQQKMMVDSEGTIQRLTVLNPRTVSLCWSDIKLVGESNTTSPSSDEQEDADDGDSSNGDKIPIATTDEEQQEEQGLLLQIKSIDPSSWLSKCTCLAEGQVILKIQDTPCFDMSPAEARSLLQEELNREPESFSITTYGLPQIRGRNGGLRRAFMGVGGSVLVGAGVAIMATPLHPLGHAVALGGGHVMTYGGMGVISSQLKGPKNKSSDGTKGASRTFRDRWSSSIRRRQSVEAQQSREDDAQQIESEESPSIEACNDTMTSTVKANVSEDQNEGGIPTEKSTSFLQRARLSWRRRRADSYLSSQQSSFDALEDEIKTMEKSLNVQPAI